MIYNVWECRRARGGVSATCILSTTSRAEVDACVAGHPQPASLDIIGFGSPEIPLGDYELIQEGKC